MERRAAWVIGAVFGGLFLCLFGFLFILFLAVGSRDGSRGLGSGDRVGVVEVIGEIKDAKKTLEQLKEFGERSNVKAVVEMTRLVEVQRAYQTLSAMMGKTDELRAKAINRLADQQA